MSRIITYLKKNQRYVELDLAHAETISDHEWGRDVKTEKVECYWKLQEPLPTRELKEEYRKLEKECDEAYVPRFPFIQTCLFLGAITHSWKYWRLNCVMSRPWNEVPDSGGRDMWDTGATIIDMTKYKYTCATILPPHKLACWSRKQKYRQFRLRPLDGHAWLTGFDEKHPTPYLNHVRIIGEKERIPVTSMQEIREVWPSFPPDPPSADSDSEDDGENDTGQKDGETVKEAPALKTEGPPPSRKDQPADISRKRKRDEQQRVWDTIEELLVSCPSAKLGNRKKQTNFRSLLKRFMGEHPELFASKHPGAVPLLLTAFVYSNKAIKDLDLHQFRSLSGDQVVDLVRGVVNHNKTVNRRAPPDLKILDISFNPFVTLDHLVHIVELTAIDELIVWNNPGLSREDVAKVANGRIAKVTTRADFLKPFEMQARSDSNTERSLVPFDPPPPIVSPMPIKIRQVIWMMLGTIEVNPSASRLDFAGQLQMPQNNLSLEELDLEALTTLLHPNFQRDVYGINGDNRAHAQLVAFPHHDAWVPLAEFYTSITRFEEFMANEWFIDDGYRILGKSWPLSFPVLMATGNKQSEFCVSSPLPFEAFSLAIGETLGGDDEKSLITRGPYPIVQGEYTLVFLREPDHGRLRFGLVTRTWAGQLEVLDPGTAAHEAGDMMAARVWQRHFDALSPWTGEENTKEREGEKVDQEQSNRYCRNTMLLDGAAVEKILAAATKLSASCEEVEDKLWELRDWVRKTKG